MTDPLRWRAPPYRRIGPGLTSRGRVAFAVALVLTLFSADPAPSFARAPDESLLSGPVASWWYHGKSAEELDQLGADNHARITDIEIEQSSPTYLFSAVLVRNEDAFEARWAWSYDQTEQELRASLAADGLRIIDVEARDTGSGVRFAAVMVANTAPQRDWWWYPDASLAEISEALDANGARLIDIDVYAVGFQRRYSAVMIANTGADRTAWWWYTGLNPTEINDVAAANDARPIDIEYDESSGTYAMIMVACPCPSWWLSYDQTEGDIDRFVAQNGARIIDIEVQEVDGEKRYSAVMVNNSNAITTRVGNLLRGGTDGDVGLYLKEVAGPVLGALRERYVFEPASTIKVVLHLYAMREVQAGRTSLLRAVPVYEGDRRSCPGETIAFEPLHRALKLMMRESDNTRTKAIVQTFGAGNINSMSQSIGMRDTSINHTMGCGFEALQRPNRLTLADVGLLYERVADGTLLSGDARETFYQLMAGKEMYLEEGYDWTGIWSPGLDDIIDQEAPATLTTVQRVAFKGLMRLNYKAGGYSFCIFTLCTSNPYHLSVAGWAQIPFCSGGSLSPRRYVFGTFISGATNEAAANGTLNATKAELLREQIAGALSTWAPCAAVATPTVTAGAIATDTPTPSATSTPTPKPPATGTPTLTTEGLSPTVTTAAATPTAALARRRATAPAAGVEPTSAPAAVSTAPGMQAVAGRAGGATGRIVFPDTGEGRRGDATAWLVASLALAGAGAAALGAGARGRRQHGSLRRPTRLLIRVPPTCALLQVAASVPPSHRPWQRTIAGL